MAIPPRFERGTPRLGIWCSFLTCWDHTTKYRFWHPVVYGQQGHTWPCCSPANATSEWPSQGFKRGTSVP